jgi:hypothetical protein
MNRTMRCRYCGATIKQAATGRPRQFCDDAHRRLYAKAMVSTESRVQPPLVLLDRENDAEQRLRALHAELRAAVSACYELANELERRSDLPQHSWRFAAVGTDLERSLDKNFHDLEGKPNGLR